MKFSINDKVWIIEGYKVCRGEIKHISGLINKGYIVHTFEPLIRNRLTIEYKIFKRPEERQKLINVLNEKIQCLEKQRGML
jgi:hypothetical protein